MMKTNFFFTLALFTAISAGALPVPASYSPTRYECNGDGVELTVDVGRMPGPGNMPGYIVTLKEGERDSAIVAHGDQLEVQNAVFGKVLSVSTEYVPDFRTRHASVVIPRINLDANLEKVDFETLLVVTNKMTTWGGPAYVRGLVDRSEVKPLHCEASYPPIPGLPR